jgi:hypothetical protein
MCYWTVATNEHALDEISRVFALQPSEEPTDCSVLFFGAPIPLQRAYCNMMKRQCPRSDEQRIVPFSRTERWTTNLGFQDDLRRKLWRDEKFARSSYLD